MITWMQRHKKYLVITVWISVISFVGAGVVGWGSVDLNTSRSKYVAKVDNLGISHKEFNNAYSTAFAMQNQLSNGELTNEEALKMGLDKIVLSKLIQSKLLLKYAKDIGFSASEDEIYKSIANDPMFYKNDNEKIFDKNKYLETLKYLNISEKDYANDVKNKLEILKLLKLLEIKPSTSELDFTIASLGIEDDLEIKIVKLNENEEKISINNEELQKYWEEHRDEYKSDLTYNYSIYTLKPLDREINSEELLSFWNSQKHKYKNQEGKILSYDEAKDMVKTDYLLEDLEKQAKIDYIKLKKKELDFKTSKIENAYSEINNHTKELKEGEISKPFILNNEYYIVRLDKINNPVVLEFSEALENVKEDFIDFKRDEILMLKAQAVLKEKTINGKKIGFISKDSKNNTDLTDVEFFTFINELFLKEDKKSYIKLHDKVVVYEILSQRFKKIKDDSTKDNIIESLKNINFNTIYSDLLRELNKRYKIEIYYKGSEF